LTDETARENYEKFGNPDGKQALEVSIGLPTWLLENPKVVLVLYLVAIVVIIPIGVGLWYANSKQYGEKNIKYETYSLFYQLLNEGSRLKSMPEVFSAATECRDLHRSDLAREEFGKLFGKLKNQKLMQKTKFDHPSILQTNLLLHAHVFQLVDSDLTEV
jgi:translocation protein SEC63